MELGAGGIDGLGAEIGLEALEHELARAQQDMGDVPMIAEDALKRLGGLRADPADAAEFLEKRPG